MGWPAIGDMVTIAADWDGPGMRQDPAWLELEAGNQVLVTYRDEDGWLYGRVHGTDRVGWFGGDGCSALMPLGPSSHSMNPADGPMHSSLTSPELSADEIARLPHRRLRELLLECNCPDYFSKGESKLETADRIATAGFSVALRVHPSRLKTSLPRSNHREQQKKVEFPIGDDDSASATAQGPEHDILSLSTPLLVPGGATPGAVSTLPPNYYKDVHSELRKATNAALKMKRALGECQAAEREAIQESKATNTEGASSTKVTIPLSQSMTCIPPMNGSFVRGLGYAPPPAVAKSVVPGVAPAVAKSVQLRTTGMVAGRPLKTMQPVCITQPVASTSRSPAPVV